MSSTLLSTRGRKAFASVALVAAATMSMAACGSSEDTSSASASSSTATDKVRFQGQEVAFVVADDHYAARDALELIDVEYEPLPVVVDPRRALDADAPVIRDDKEGKTDNHIFDWEAGDEAETDAVFADADVVVVTQDDPVPARPPRAAGDVRRGRGLRRRHRQAAAVVHDAGAARAPHAVRARGGAARAQDPGDRARHRRRLRQQGPDLPGLRVRDRRLDRHRQAGEVDGGPHGEPDLHRLRPRLPDAGPDRRRPRRADPRAARRHAGRPRRVQRHRAADEVPGRVLPHLHRLVRPRGGVLHGEGRLHEQGARRRRLPLLVPRHRGGVPRRADGRPARRRAGDGPGRAADARTSSGPSSSRTRRKTGWTYDSGDYEETMREAMRIAGYDELRARAGREARSAAS